MSLVAELMTELRELRFEVSSMKRDMAAMNRVGFVSDVDAAKGYRLQFGEDDKGAPIKSPWLPHPEQGGDILSWVPLAKGQIAMLVSEPGDTRKAFLLRGGFAGAFKQPSQDLGEAVLAFGDVRISVRKDKVEIAVGDSRMVLEKDKTSIAVGRSSIAFRDKDIEVKARRTFHRGKIAAGLDYDSTAKVFPSKVGTQSGPAKLVYSTTIAEEIPDDD